MKIFFYTTLLFVFYFLSGNEVLKPNYHSTKPISSNHLEIFNTAIVDGGTPMYVKTVSTGSGDGSDWDNALGSADLEMALENGGTVYIAAGVYLPGTEFFLSSDLCAIGDLMPIVQVLTFVAMTLYPMLQKLTELGRTDFSPLLLVSII